MAASRQYDLVVFGATGYTGKLTAEHIATYLPTDLKWALAGRSSSKLGAVAEDCKALNANRSQPALEICSLDDKELDALAKKTKLIIATVGPYALYGEHAFRACADNGTHYLDVTGEVPYVSEMIKKYEKTAKANGAIMIPQIGVESCPSDMVTWIVVDMIRKKFSAPTGEVVLSVHEINSKASGGTLNTVLSLLDVFSLKELGAAHAPYGISPIPGPKVGPYRSILTSVLGIREVRDLGILTTSLSGMVDTPIVQRSWGLLGGVSTYGPNFRYSEYMKARNYLGAIMIHYALLIGSVLLAISPLRRIIRKFVYQPGDGPTKEESRNDRLEYRAIAMPDLETPTHVRAYCRARYDGSLYAFTGACLAQAAISILRDEHDLKGGVYTPACLGQKFVNRLENGGMKFETKFFDN